MKFISLIVSAFLVFTMGLLAQSPEAAKAYNDANTAYRQGKVDLALQKYQEAVQLDPNFAQAYYGLGNVYKRKRDYVNAEKAYKNAIEKDSKFVNAYNYLGYVQYRQGQYTEALNSYQAAINIDPNFDKPYWGIGDVYRKQENYQKAIEYYRKALEIDPKEVIALKGLAVSLMETGKHEEAVSALQAIIENTNNKSTLADAYYRLGNAYRELGRFNEAEEAYKNCLANARQSTIKGGANFGLGEIYKKRGNVSQAIAYFQAASQDRTWKKSAEYEIDMLKNADKYTQ